MSDPVGTVLRRWLKRGWPGGADVYWGTRRRIYGAMRGRIGQDRSDRLQLRRRRFERAYSSGAWTSTGESLSGDGSTLRATEHIRAALPGTLRDLDVRTLLDVPCGDWNWMCRLALDIDKYVGGDIVPSVVDANRHRFGDERHEFRVIDLCVDPLPSADLLLCRDAWIHFSYEDIRRSIANITRANIEFLATTTFPETTANTDVVTGKYWRHLNLEAAPFHLPPPMLSLPDNFNRPDQVLSIWRVSDLRRLSLTS